MHATVANPLASTAFFRSGLLDHFVHVLAVAEWLIVRVGSIWYRKTKCSGKGVLFSLLDPLDFLSSLPCSLFLLGLPVLRTRIVAFSIPAEIPALLPSADRRHQRVAQIVISTGRRLDIAPFEIACAASGAFLPYRS